MLRIVKRAVKRLLSLDAHQQYALIEEIRSGLLSQASMVLHIGAHKGTEVSLYGDLGLSVVWIEGNPELFPELCENLRLFPNQIAICSLLGGVDLDKVDFHIANNDGQSSSIFNFGSQMNHKDLVMSRTIELPMRRLDSVLQDEQVPKGSHWVIDVQGAELEVIRGAGDLIRNAYSLEVEVSTKDEYSGGAKFEEVNTTLNSLGLFPLWKPKANSHEDIFFMRRF
jgi:FkbM family methyltransferase